MIMRKRIGEMGDKIFHQNVNYRKHLGLFPLVRCVNKSEYYVTLMMLNYILIVELAPVNLFIMKRKLKENIQLFVKVKPQLQIRVIILAKS